MLIMVFTNCFLFGRVRIFQSFILLLVPLNTLFQRKRRKRTASWLRERVLQLGPTFIKLGQLSSTRSDLFYREYVEELAKLQVL